MKYNKEQVAQILSDYLNNQSEESWLVALDRLQDVGQLIIQLPMLEEYGIADNEMDDITNNTWGGTNIDDEDLN